MPDINSAVLNIFKLMGALLSSKRGRKRAALKEEIDKCWIKMEESYKFISGAMNSIDNIVQETEINLRNHHYRREGMKSAIQKIEEIVSKVESERINGRLDRINLYTQAHANVMDSWVDHYEILNITPEELKNDIDNFMKAIIEYFTSDRPHVYCHELGRLINMVNVAIIEVDSSRSKYRYLETLRIISNIRRMCVELCLENERKWLEVSLGYKIIDRDFRHIM